MSMAQADATKVTMYMRWYVADYVNDTDHLSLIQHGAYALLLMKLWQHDGWLPLDHAQLARLCRVSRRQWTPIWAAIEGYFENSSPTGFFTQKRLLEELALAKARCATAIESGRRGGLKKAANGPGNPSGNPSGNPTSNPSGNPTRVHSSRAAGTLEQPYQGPSSEPSSRFLAGQGSGVRDQIGEDSGEASRPSPQPSFVLLPETGPEPEPEPPALMVFPCVRGRGGGPTWSLTDHDLQILRGGFPAVDVLAECRQALVWAIANPSRQKTAGGMLAFLTRWMTKAQNRGGTPGHVPPGSGHVSASVSPDANALFAAMTRRQAERRDG